MSRYLIFDVNSLIKSRSAWIEATKNLARKYQLNLPENDACFYNLALGHLLEYMGVHSDKHVAYLGDVWKEFATIQQEEQRQTKSVVFEHIKQALDDLSNNYELGIISPNVPYINEMIEKGGLIDHNIRIFEAKYDTAFVIVNGCFTSLSQQKEARRIAGLLNEKPIFITQSIDFAYALSSCGQDCIVGGWGWCSKEAHAKYLPSLLYAQTPEDLISLLSTH